MLADWNLSLLFILLTTILTLEGMLLSLMEKNADRLSKIGIEMTSIVSSLQRLEDHIIRLTKLLRKTE